MDKELYVNCCGCTTCSLVCPADAIKMKEDKEGFLAPVIDKDTCIECGLCLKHCRFKHRINHNIPHRSFGQEVYALRLRSKRKRKQSQSGGAFASLAETFLLNHAGVYGVRQKEDFTACYTRINHINQLHSLTGSKYVQAEINDMFEKVNQDLTSGMEVFFCGTACCIDGLYEYLMIQNCVTAKLVTCDIICHGVPSPLLVRDYITEVEQTYHSKVVAFNYRDKRLGWRGHSESFRLENNRVMLSQNFVKIFQSGLSLRESCYQCPYASLDRVSDITIGDCWGIEHVNPKFDDNKGCSLMLIHSYKGREAFERIRGNVEIQEIDREKVLQPNLKHPTPRPERRSEFWETYDSEGFKKTVERFCGYDTDKDRDFIKVKNELRLIKDQIIRKLR